MAVARLRYRMWERANPDKPWLCPGTIAFCQAHLTKSMLCVEFGSGRSTRWFATLVGRIISIEHNTQWHAIVKDQLKDTANIDYRLIPLNHAESQPEQPSYSPVPDYVAAADGLHDRSVDFAIVDGHYRTNCVRHLVPKIAPNGYLLVDDINLWPSLESLPVPPSWKIVDDSTNGVKRCIIWQSVPS